LLAALASATASGPAHPALCTDGEHWLPRAELLDAALSAATDLGPSGPPGTVPPTPDSPASGTSALDIPDIPALDIPALDPLTTVTALLAAEARGAVPVIRDPAWPADVARRQVELAAKVRPAKAPFGTDHAAAGPLMVLPTSGTSATPRLVLRTVRSWRDSLKPFTAVTGITDGDVVWAPGGPSSTLTLFAVWQAVACGLPVVAGGRWRGVVASGPAVRRATAVQCVPAVLADVVAAKEAGLLPLLRVSVVAGAALPPALRRRAEATGLAVVEYYGAAELSFVAVDTDGTGLRPFPGVELDVRTGGAVWVRSPYLARGYLDPTSPGPLRRTAAGWSSVGDRGSLTAGGALVLRGRGSDSVSVGGQVVLVGDVEAVLGDVDGVVEVVCLAEPHARLGERVVVAVRPVDGTDPLPAMRLAARSHLPPAARPVRYLVLAEFPRTSGGKIARATLRDQLTAPAPAPAPALGAAAHRSSRRGGTPQFLARWHTAPR
jgi:acyl-CoA synthetase (AMP-forming)/AMP-acid ligase II